MKHTRTTTPRQGLCTLWLRAVVLALALLAVCSMGALAERYTARVNTDSRVYQQPSLSSRYGSLPKGMQVDVIATCNGWAMIENNGIVGYTNAAHVTAVTEQETPSLNAKPAIITADTSIYLSPSTSSLSMRVPKGMQVNLMAVNGDWAMVENCGIVAYMNAAHVSLLSDLSPTATPAPTETPAVTGEPAIITADTSIYVSPSTSSLSARVPKGMQVNLIAVNGSWAMVENGGIIAYMNAAHVCPLSDLTPTATPAPEQPDYSDLLPNAKDAVLTADALVYKTPDTSGTFMGIPKGLKVKLLAVNGDWALIECNGNYGFTKASIVSVVDTATPTPSPSATPEPEQPDYSDLLPNAKDAVINTDTKVYKFADLSSTSMEISKGTQVRLLAVNGDWALIERDGAYGFTNAAHVSEAVQPTPDPGDYFESDKYSNEEKCYLFLTGEMGLNRAAASGILANIRRESNFNPASGSSYYGLCQWGGGRLSNLKSFCSKNGYSSSSLEGQLRFLWHELQNSYPSILRDLQSVPNTAQGAYDAGYLFCYDYERPAAKESSSVSRGNLARDTYFPKYA